MAFLPVDNFQRNMVGNMVGDMVGHNMVGRPPTILNAIKTTTYNMVDMVGLIWSATIFLAPVDKSENALKNMRLR